jgi:(S)-citramalyl-CoA lyase
VTGGDAAAPAAGRRRRSWLFTPGTRPDRFARAAEAGADVLIIDLEDAVAPAAKPRARADALAFLAAAGGGCGGAATALRINALRTPAGLADLAALLEAPAHPDYVLVPKAEAAAEIGLVDALLGSVGSPARLVALIESARGLAAVDAIAGAAPRLAALMLGAADLAADLGAAVAWEPLLLGRSAVVRAAALGGVPAIDSPCFELRDPDALAAELRGSMALGFAAKAAIHPAQVGPINAALTPTPEAVAEARRILEENAKGVGVVAGRMIDEAVARRARRTLAAAGTA